MICRRTYLIGVFQYDRRNQGLNEECGDIHHGINRFSIIVAELQGNHSMGLKKWLAKVSGPKGYGNVLGPPTIETGSALANIVFMSHGIEPNGGPTTIFDTAADMEAAGFAPRFQKITQIDLVSMTLEEQLLFKNLQTAMIAFAYMVNSNGADQYMRRDNSSKFRKGLVPSLLRSMVHRGLFSKDEAAQTEITPYLASSDAAQIRVILNIEKPASSDLLENFIVRAVGLCQSKLRYGFARTGLTGFDVIAVALVEETLKSILGATRQYNW